MRRSLGGVCALVAWAAAMPAQAQDWAGGSTFDWSGLYAGGNAGGAWGTFSGSVGLSPTEHTDASSAHISHHDSSFTGGGQLGFKWQFGQWVLGADGDFDSASLSGRSVLGDRATGSFEPQDAFSAKSSWRASIRGRAGYAWDRWLVYATGGVAFAHVRATSDFVAVGDYPESGGSGTDTLTGGTVGGGLAYAFTDSISVEAEGSYTSYGRGTFHLGSVAVYDLDTNPAGPGPFEVAAATGRIGLQTTQFVLKLNWKFD